MVIVPQFEFDVPPPPAAITQVAPPSIKAAARSAGRRQLPSRLRQQRPSDHARNRAEARPPLQGAGISRRRPARQGTAARPVVSVCVDVEGRMSNAKARGRQRLGSASTTPPSRR
jgi:hypothetical protein